MHEANEVDEYAEILCLALLTRVFVNVCLQLWSPLLEKAFAIHAGGWDPICGDSPAYALAALTGCLDTVMIYNGAGRGGRGSKREDYQYTEWKPDFSTMDGNTSHSGRFYLLVSEILVAMMVVRSR